MIDPPLNDFSCLTKFTDVAQKATEHSEVQRLAGGFLARNHHNVTAALGDMRRWLRNKPQVNDNGHGPEPRVDCGAVQQRVDYLGERPNCSERTILYCALGEHIDPDSIRQMATIKTSAGLHTFPLENGEPIVLDPLMTRNALLLGVHAMRNSNGAEEMNPLDLVSFVLDIADEPAREYRNGRDRIDNAEQALQRAWRGQTVSECPKQFRNALSDIAWTFALARAGRPRLRRLRFRCGAPVSHGGAIHDGIPGPQSLVSYWWLQGGCEHQGDTQGSQAPKPSLQGRTAHRQASCQNGRPSRGSSPQSLPTKQWRTTAGRRRHGEHHPKERGHSARPSWVSVARPRHPKRPSV